MITDNLNLLGKFALYTGAIKHVKNDKNEIIKLRLLHPFGIVCFLITLVIAVFIGVFEGVLEFKYAMEEKIVLW